MTVRVILQGGPEHGRVLPAEAASAEHGEVLSKGGWTYQLTGETDERGMLIAKGYMD
ncbi:hypothetical protein [Streptomyces sp. NPDC047070]|uniref:hypothetical protein n=1 Tax=Streptomyces sp. NPDC047070 TaxID=3154923 RepID=UPI003455D176